VTGSILNLAYGYDANGNITSILDTVNPPGGEVLGPPGTYTYQTGTNKLIHIEGTPTIDFGYDANANITTENTWTYVYDLSNQLVTVLNNSNQVAAYTYNGAGQRIKKVTQTETRVFHYDLRGHLIAETNQTGQTLTEYIYLGDQLLSMIKPGESVYYFHNDHLRTPQVLTDDTQTVAWKAVYTPFGEAVASVQTVDNPFRFPGQYYDPETGLHYNYFRYHNPQTGRYITPDPIGLEGGINLFVYTTNNPINAYDPTGTIRVPGLKYLADKAVRLAWQMERRLVAAGEEGTVKWTEREAAELLAKGKVSGYCGHHINSVAKNPKIAGDPANVAFRTYEEHFAAHEFNWQTQTAGKLIDRTLKGKIVGIGVAALYGFATVLEGIAEAAEYSDPVSAFLKVMAPVELGE
jgi:RHS repeat-associated protein